jgi:protein-disulfide isomerase
MEEFMNRRTCWSAAASAIAFLFLVTLSASKAQDSHEALDALVKEYLAAHPEEVREIVKDYVVSHPDVFRGVLGDALKRQPAAVAGPDAKANPSPIARASDAVKNNADTLFRSARQVTLGNPGGDVTMVEFFDYNCGYCKGALPAMLTLLKDDPRLKIVLKEWPILGPGSVEAAQVAIAVHMQDSGGQKYLAFHRKLLGDPGPANREKALAAAEAAGIDMTRLQRDMASDEVRATIGENVDLARAVGINGTPGYVIGDTVVAGAVGVAALQDQIGTARAHVH